MTKLDKLEIPVTYMHGLDTDGNAVRVDLNGIATWLGKSSKRVEWLTDERDSALGKKNYSRPRDLSTVRDHDPKRAHEVRCNEAETAVRFCGCGECNHSESSFSFG